MNLIQQVPFDTLLKPHKFQVLTVSHNFAKTFPATKLAQSNAPEWCLMKCLDCRVLVKNFHE